jgi:dTDP-4-amino-4,6-dideoxygalactose transaminase
MLSPTCRAQQAPAPLNGAPTYYLFWARNALYHGLIALGVSSGDTVLVPSFHCATAVEPILKCGAKVTFYNIRRDCLPDFGDIESKIDDKTRAVLAIHYFGFPQPIRKLQELCKERQLYLIEDCAHVLTGNAQGAALGSFGDIGIFSWRKFLPVYDGGQLVINNPTLHVHIPWEKNNLLFQLKLTKNIIDKIIDDCSSKAVRIISHMLQVPGSIGRSLLSAGRCLPRAFSINNYSSDFDPSSVNLPMSVFSRYILRNIDIPTIVEKRRANYIRLLEAVQSIPGLTPFFPELPDGVCPWVFPVVAAGRQDIHVTLRSKGIPASTWGGVIHPELPIDKFPDADFLYRNLIFLPVHQSLGEAEMRTIVDVVAEVVEA